MNISEHVDCSKGGEASAMPLAALDVIERAGLLAEAAALAGDGDGGLVIVAACSSRLARLFRRWPDAADDLAGVLGESGYYAVETLVVVHIRPHRGCE